MRRLSLKNCEPAPRTRDNQAQLQAAENAAVRANVSFFPVDARGLVAQAPLGDATHGSPGGSAMYSGSGPMQAAANLAKTQDTMWGLAADTGGKALLDNNDLGTGIVQAEQAISSYYILGYYTTNENLALATTISSSTSFSRLPGRSARTASPRGTTRSTNTMRGAARWILKRPADLAKDQTYFLFGLTQEQLSHTLFPLGNMTKPEVREVARQPAWRWPRSPTRRRSASSPAAITSSFSPPISKSRASRCRRPPASWSLQRRSDRPP